MYRRALAIKEQLLGADSPDSALTQNNLGALLIERGQQQAPAIMLEQALAALQQRLPAEHPHVALAGENVARAWRRWQPVGHLKKKAERVSSLR